MKIPGFCQETYEARTIVPDDPRLMNLFPEVSREKNDLILIGTPGYALWGNLPDYPLRAKLLNRGILYVISGGTLYSVTSAGAYTVLGHIDPAGVANVDTNGTQLLITTGSRAYVYTIGTGVLTDISGDTDGTMKGVFWEGYFVGVGPGSQTLWYSSQYNGLAWNGLDFTSAEGAPDYVKKIITDHRELVAFGEESTEFFNHSQDPEAPLSPNRGAHIEHGIDAPESAVKLDNCIFWIGGSSRGRGQALKVEGYRSQVVSPPGITAAWATYSTIADAQGFAYEDEGHAFWVVNFPTANRTWVYDASTGLWHERGYWHKASATWQVHKAFCHVYAFGKHLIGDRENGNIYEMKMTTYSDNGDDLRRLRQPGHLFDENKRIYQSSLEVHAEMGLGLGSGQGSNPKMMMRYSNDGGRTWSNEYSAPLGKQGQFRNRAVWNRLGSGPDRVYEITCSEPTQQHWIDAYVN